MYTGSTLATLTEVACNDDSIGLQWLPSFPATAGQTYHFQVGGLAGDTGNLTFNLAKAGT